MSEKDEILAKLHQLPVLPAAMQEVIASFGNSDLDSAMLARKIAQDQGLSARMLRVANSPFYGLTRKVGSIHDAVVVMGFNSVRSLALMAGLANAFPSGAHRQFDREAHWKRSFCVAGYAEALAQCLRHDRYMAFTAGMLYDIGQLVLDVCVPERFSAMLEQHKTTGQDLIGIERAELGVDHAQLGAEMARRWNFPVAIEHAIRHWRTPGSEPVAGMVHVAALLESGLRGEELVARLPDVLHDQLEINWGRIESCLPERERLDAISGMMLAA